MEYELYAPPAHLEALATDFVVRRRRFSLQSIIEVSLEIKQRESLGREKLARLDELLADLRSSLRGRLDRFSPDFQKLYATVLKEQLTIESLAVQEPIDRWRDLAQLRQELRTLWKGYLGVPEP